MDQSEGDKVAIRKVVTDVGRYWDSHQFSEAKALFTPMVEVDYTSLGAPDVTQDPIDQLEGNWKAVLPMFDITAHHIDSFTFAPVDANTVEVGSKVLAYHYLSGATSGDESWVLRGRYTHQLTKQDEDGQWKIAKMKLQVEEQTGNLGLIIEATTTRMS